MLETGTKRDPSKISQEKEGTHSSYQLYRTITKEHIPKKHLNFEEPIKTDKVFDNTHNRINGERRDELMITENRLYGTGKNPADSLPKVGKRTQLMER